jgi:hypothetical protein
MLPRIMKATLAIVGIFLTVTLCNAAGLGSNYVGKGNVYVTITKNPHSNSHPWGFVNPYTGEDIELGVTDEVGQRRFVGYYEDQIIQFWADGKNKRYHTGHGQNQNVTDRFVINGVQFFIESESTELIPAVNTLVEASDCSDSDINWTPVNVNVLQYRQSKTPSLMVLRITVSGSGIDWTLFTDGEVTAEVTLNNSCDLTYNLTDTIGYFDCKIAGSCSSSGVKRQYEGYRLTDYDYPAGPVTYPAKIRVTKDKNGMNQHYLYINYIEDHSDLVGSNVNLKIKLYQNGTLIQAFDGDGVMTTNM